MKLTRGLVYLLLFNVLYLLVALVYYLSIGSYEFIWYIVVVVLIGLLVAGTLGKTKLDYLALWGLSIWGFLHMLAGSPIFEFGTLYSLKLIPLIDRGGDFFVLKMDQVIHFYGFAVAALVVYEMLYHRAKLRAAGFMVFIAIIGSMGLGALNEIVEFIAMVSFEKTGVGDVYNTGLDLIFNMFGAIAGAYLGRWWMGRKK